jgi:glyoxylase-like metal-dependent hydrolase (beta-lactamase superfamily II)
MEIAPSVHAVRLLSGSSGFLICEPRMTLIDAGLPGSGRRLARYASRLGRSLDELDTIVCTHAHPDHIGGVREIVTESGANVLMHPADLAGLNVTLREAVTERSHNKLIAYLTRGPEDATPIQDGDELPALGGLRVIHTPGHTPGTICLYAPRHRLLFVGDALQVIRGRVTFASPIFSHDLPLARASIARLAELDVETIAFSHYPPWRDRSAATLRALARRAASA